MSSGLPKRTKIVCTIGPASRTPATLTAMVHAGMNVARLNFSHGTHEDHAVLMRTIRAVAKRTGEPICILQDLQGPKIRIGVVPDAGIVLESGKTITLTTATSACRNGKIPITYRNLHRDVAPGHRILIDDGLIEVHVTRVRARDILAEVVIGGTLTSHKGFNLPDTRTSLPALTPKDRRDAAFGIANNVDWIALSFVKSANDVFLLRKLIHRAGGRQQIMVKVEKHEAITHFTEILEAADGVMVARGDLGVEIPAAEVPLRQKAMIEECRAAGKPVIVATQMLDSMIRNPRPTRAEVSDVANAIIDHTDAIMLSGESATGKYPVEAVRMMASIAHETEASTLDDVPLPMSSSPWEGADVVAEVTALLATHAENIHAILVATLTGRTACRIVRFRPQLPVIAATPDETVLRQLNLGYAIHPIRVPMARDRAAFLRAALRVIRTRQLVPRGKSLVIVSGDPWGHPGTSNSVAVERVR